jgi:hypothetical protein
MKQLNWYQIFGNTHKIPDGRTVEPTDDIQIWLNCANIWDKPYTLLAEVLADTDTLLALITSNNAVDYMVRSTTWATPQALVPHMTSNTTPSGVCSSSSNIATYDPYKAFDGTNTNEYDCWHSDGTVPQWLGYAFTTPTCVSKVSLTSRNMSNNGVMPATFKIQGSNDGVNWDELGSYSWTHGLAGNYTDTFSIPGTDSYLYVRLYGDSAVVSGAKINIGLIQYYSACISESSTAMTLIGANNYASNTLLADATWRTAICDSEYFESVLNVKVPTMTGYTTPSGVASASSENLGTQSAWKAFNNNTSDAWLPVSGATNNYISYEFASSADIYKIDLYYKVQGTTPARTYKIQYGNSYTDADTLFIPSDSGSATLRNITKVLSNKISSNKFRLYCSDTLYSSGNWYINTAELQFYGRKDI